jgi:acetylornithine deacetylase/succinyl-diaminopimelate desuccinylase-like protein
MLRSTQNDLVATLSRLIAFPTYEESGMQLCAEFLSSELSRLGFQVDVDRLWNVFGEKEFGEGEGSFLLNSHFDTVPPTPRWTKNPLRAELADDRLYGLGASDDKASAAAMLHSLAELRSCRFGKLEVLFSNYEDNRTTLDGETWLGTPYFLAHHKLDSRSGVNVEGTVEGDRFMVSLGCGGRVGFTATTIGKEAHSSDPRLGRNAIYDMVRVIEALRKLPPARMVLDGHEAYTELNVSKIQGGIAINIVPGECEIVCERRVLPNEEWDAVKKQVDEVLADIKDVKLNVSFMKPQRSYQIPRTHSAVTLAKQAIEAILDYQPKFKVESGRTDSTYFDEAGIKTVILGPGEVAHIADEYVTVKRLEEFTQVLSYILAKEN